MAENTCAPKSNRPPQTNSQTRALRIECQVPAATPTLTRAASKHLAVDAEQAGHTRMELV